MKKLISLMMCLVIILGIVASASAQSWFYYSGNNTQALTGARVPAPPNGKRWHMWWHPYSNQSPTNRAVIRILAEGGGHASALWVYSTKSEKFHDYYSQYAYGQANTYVGARLDNRDNGYLWIAGWFYN